MWRLIYGGDGFFLGLLAELAVCMPLLWGVDTSSSQMDHDIRHVYCSTSPTTNEKDRARRLLFLETKRHRSTTHARRHIFCFSMGKSIKL